MGSAASAATALSSEKGTGQSGISGTAGRRQQLQLRSWLPVILQTSVRTVPIAKDITYPVIAIVVHIVIHDSALQIR
jgi:hypothetical protein